MKTRHLQLRITRPESVSLGADVRFASRCHLSGMKCQRGSDPAELLLLRDEGERGVPAQLVLTGSREGAGGVSMLMLDTVAVSATRI